MRKRACLTQNLTRKMITRTRTHSWMDPLATIESHRWGFPGITKTIVNFSLGKKVLGKKILTRHEENQGMILCFQRETHIYLLLPKATSNLSEGSRNFCKQSRIPSFRNSFWTGKKSFYVIGLAFSVIPDRILLPQARCQKVINCKHNHYTSSWQFIACRGVLSVLSRVLTYQIISDQRANLLSTWVRALLFMINCVNGSSHQHSLLRRFLKQELHVWRKTSIWYRLKVDTVPFGMKRYLYLLPD